MYSRAEKYFNGFDGTKLFLQTWSKPDAKATILITHGQAEHSDCYQRLIDGLGQNLSVNFVAWDLRGHGKSDGLRGFAKDFSDYVQDYELFIQQALDLPQTKNKKKFILGHSMGGLIQTCSLIEKKDSQFFKNIQGQILSSPFFGLTMPVPLWKESAAGLINQFLPQLTLGNEINFELLTREIDIIKEYEKDTYRHSKISTGVFIGIKRELKNLESKLSDIKLPTFMSISDHDPVVSTSAAISFFNSISSVDKTLKIIDGAKHELYNDTCRDEVFKSVSDFILKGIS